MVQGMGSPTVSSGPRQLVGASRPNWPFSDAFRALGPSGETMYRFSLVCPGAMAAVKKSQSTTPGTASTLVALGATPEPGRNPAAVAETLQTLTFTNATAVNVN